jgi:two-component system cell cycle response regulator
MCLGRAIQPPSAFMKLLLAEDEEFQRKLLERRLSRAGYQVDTVDTGERALNQLMTGGYQILITDWDMPGMDGATLCRRIREAQLPGYLYILMLTAHTGVADTVTGLEAGADDYLQKPADEAELLARIKAGRRIVELERSLSAAHEEVRRLSLMDPLLGCYNRRYLNEQLSREIERARRYGTELAVVMADLDGFKKVNDLHGHLVGDEILKGFTTRAASALRHSADWIARYGGEEFTIVLPHTNLEGALSCAEKIRVACASTPFSTTAGELTLTVSLGVASLRAAPDVKSAMSDLLRHADAALYRSKGEGRNRVTLALDQS